MRWDWFDCCDFGVYDYGNWKLGEFVWWVLRCNDFIDCGLVINFII